MNKMVLNVGKVLLGAASVVVGVKAMTVKNEKMEEAKKAKKEIDDAIEYAKQFPDEYSEEDEEKDVMIKNVQYAVAVIKNVIVPRVMIFVGTILLMQSYYGLKNI